MNFVNVNSIKPKAAKALHSENQFIRPKTSKNAMNRSSVRYADTLRQFGKDISNYIGLTVATNENSTLNYRKASDLAEKYSKKRRIANKNALLEKLSNYNIKQRDKLSKSFIQPINEVPKKHEQHQNHITTTTEAITECNGDNMEMDIDIEQVQQQIQEQEQEQAQQPIKLQSDVIITKIQTREQLQQCDEYIDDIFTHLKEIEFNHSIPNDYISKQSDINEKMRGILLDWLIEVHLKFKLLPETIYLTANIIDRFLAKTNIIRTKLQLVGVSAMLIACKYEEIYSPEVKDFVYMTDKAYTKEEVLQMENHILGALEYNLTVPSSLRFLEVYQKYIGLNEVEIMYCKYLIEMCLVEYKFIKYYPSLIAACCMMLSMKVHDRKEKVNELFTVSGYTKESLNDCEMEIVAMIEKAEIASLQAVRRKYLLARFLEVSRIKMNQFHLFSY